MKISEAQTLVEEIIKRYGIRRNALASLAGVYEELGGLSSKILVKEGFKRGSVTPEEVGYSFAEVLFELLKLADSCNIDLEREWLKAVEKWKAAREEPRWL